MKKFTQAGKKALSVFLAALMVMTAWVFVAPEAEAITAGTYKVKVVMQTDNQFDTWDKNGAPVKINYVKTDNNATSDSVSATINEKWFDDTKEHTIYEQTVSWYPTSVTVTGRKNDPWGSTKGQFTVWFYVDDVEIARSQTNKFGDGEYFSLTLTTPEGKIPTPTVIECSSKPSASYKIPKDGEGSLAIKHVTYCKDQYGKVMALTPTISNSGDMTGITSSESNGTDKYTHTLTVTSNAKMDGTTDSRTMTTKATYSYRNKSKDCSHSFVLNDPKYTYTFNNTHGGTVTPANGATVTKAYGNTFGLTPSGSRSGFSFLGYFLGGVIDDSYDTDNTSGKTKLTSSTKYVSNLTWYAAWQANKYTATFKYRDASYNEQTSSKTQYFGTELTAPSIPTTIDPNIDHTYTFNGWSPSVDSTMQASDKTYTATYIDTPHYADYTEVVKQIGAADVKKAEAFYQEGGYTPETVQAFENAYNTAVDSNNNRLLKSKQAQVDQIANNLKSARENLKLKTFTVVFVDESGTIIKDGFFYVTYGAKVTPPATPTKESDVQYHYTFVDWDSDSDPLSACDKVVDDLKYVAKFTATAHNFRTETVASTCTSDGVIKKTCNTCGYSYTETNSDTAHHRWVENKTVKAATCAENGITATECSACGVYKTGSIKSVAKTAHSYGSWTEYTPATCAGQGVNVRECSVCHAKDYTKTNKIAHSFGTTTVVAPTCTAGGYNKRTCSMCGLVDIFDLTGATGHTSTTTTKPATCVSIGYTETTCTKCGHKTVKEIPATGIHTFGAWTKITDATCISKGVEERICSDCHTVETRLTEMKSHSFSGWSTYQEATCTSDKIEQRSCTVCGKTKTKTVSGTKGHSWNHDFTIDIAASCQSAGVQSKHCSRCDARTDVTVIPALPHNWNAGVESPKATCTTDGVKIYTCASCNTTKTEVIPKLGHNFVAGIPVAATCKSSGYIPYTCTNGCGGSYNVINGNANAAAHNWKFTTSKNGTKLTVTWTCETCGATGTQTVDVAEGHNYVNATVTKQPTCTETGMVTIACDKKHDANCTSVVTATLPVNPDAHSKIKTTVTNPTCTENGKVTTVCTSCNKAVAAEQTIPAKGHSYTTQTEYVAPTCKTEGSVTYTCTVSGCGATKTDKIPVNPNAHKFIQKANGHHDATCTTPAYDEYVCEYGCGTSYNSYSGTTVRAHDWKTEIEQNGTTLKITCTCQYADCKETHTETKTVFAGHNYSIVEEVKKATCNAEGELKIKCSDAGCDASITVAVPKNANAHNYVHIYTAPTCQREGSVTDICSICNKVLHETIVIAKLEHTWGEPAVTEPTCSKDGKRVYTCTTCPDGTTKETKEEVIPKTGHSWDGGTLHTADCTHGAYTTYKCSNCNKTYDAVADGAKALGHNWSDWVIVNPTNDTDGSVTRTCKRCNEPEKVKIPAQGHKFDASTYTETKATCTVKGSRTYTCTTHENCGVSVTVDTDFAPHSYELKYNEKATCTKDGKVVMECSVCHDSKEIVIPKFGHTWNNGEVTKEATCTETGVKTFTCSICNETRTETIEKLPHNFIAGKEVPPTCKDGGKSGYIPYTCSGCGESYSKITDKKIEHKFGDWETVQEANESRIGIEKRTCSECGAVDYKTSASTGDHQYTEEITKNPTCTEEGSKTLTCTNSKHSGEEPQVVPIPALGHDMKAGTPVAATCEHEGYTDYTCSRDNCGFTYRIITAPASDHTASKWTEVVPASCTVDGVQKKTCITCGEILAEETIPAPGHSNKTVTKNATCLEPSVSYTYCTKCNMLIGEVTVGKALGHDFDEDVDQYVAPTNSKNGKKVLKCSSCDATIAVTIPAEGHEFELVSTEKATCEKTGLETYKCKTHTGDNDCGLSYTNVIPKKEHTYATKVKTKPTCTTAGEGECYCTACKAVFGTYVIEALGHDFIKDETGSKDATCNSVGYDTYKCSRDCGETKVVYRGTLGSHKWGDWETVQTADETHPGIKVKKCSVCGLCEYETKPPTGEHVYGDGVVTKQPACTEPGEMTFTCIGKHCACTDGNRKSYTVEIAPTGHKAKIEKKDASCSEAGYIKVVCTVCNNEIGESITLEKKEHIYQSVVTTEPTCSTEGVRTHTCALCGDSYTETMSTISHDYQPTGRTVAPTCTTEGFDIYKCKNCAKETFIKTSEKLSHTEKTVTVHATCTEKGSKTVVCSVCHTILEKTEYTPALGHDWGEWKVTVPGTCAVEGKKTRECSRCGETETISTGTGEHVYPEKGVVTPATCTADGYTTYTCTVCNKYSVIRDYTPKLGHKYSADYKIIVEPTCHSTGTKAHYCVRCGAFEPDYLHNYVELPKLAHTYGEWVVTTEPTCDTNGVKTRTCTGCTDKDEGHTQTELIGKKGHNYGEWEITKKSTCVEEGSQRRYCDRCKTWEVQATPKGGHNRVADYAVEATCTAPGKTAGSHCSICGYVFVAQQEVPMKEHMDLNGDGRCEGCGKTMYSPNGETDSCLCHGTGFRAFIYKIVLIIWKIFKINKNCVCGAKHY